eukprot:673473-Rhodomonas_salina.4
MAALAKTAAAYAIALPDMAYLVGSLGEEHVTVAAGAVGDSAGQVGVQRSVHALRPPVGVGHSELSTEHHVGGWIGQYQTSRSTRVGS